MTAAPATSGSALLRPFFKPRGIALVGASRDPDAFTARPARYLKEWAYEGHVAIVNPKAGDELHGHPVVAELKDVSPETDVALVMVPADRVRTTLEACAEAGVMNAVCISSGFEGHKGAERRKELLHFLQAVPEFRLIGPNCAGIMSAVGNSVLTFSSTLLQERMVKGRVGLVVQSGAMGNGLLLALLRRGAGIAHQVSTGNEFDLGAVRIATSMLEDPACAAVGMFLEGITDPEYLPYLQRTIAETGKPVVALRAGASPLGRVAAFGHTGRLIGDDEIARAVLRGAGVRLVETVEELCDALTILSILEPRKHLGDADVGVITVSGGTGVIAADAIARSGNLHLKDLDENARRVIADEVGIAGSVTNPYDVPTLGDPGVFHRAVRGMAMHGGCDVMLAVVTTLAHDYEMLSSADYSGFPPIVFTHLSPEERFSPDQARRLAAQGVATVPSPRNAIEAISDWAGTTLAPSPLTKRSEAEQDTTTCGLISSIELMGGEVGRWTPTIEVVGSADDAVLVAERIGGPVALKAEGSIIEHRTELGAVRTNLMTPDEIKDAFESISSICERVGEKVVVQEMAARGVEVLVSIVRDPEVGLVALCRPGGVMVELGGVNTVLASDATEWPRQLEGTGVARLLSGFRGSAPSDTAALLQLISDLLAAAVKQDSIRGIECNPVLVHPVEGSQTERGASLVDISTRVSREPV